MAHRTKLFISYSHRDREWLERLQVHLRPLEREGLIAIWDDTRIKPGAKWHEEIRQALDSARVAVLLISADFLASEFIAENELPPLLAAAEHDGAVILPVIISTSRFARTPALARFQAVNSPNQPLDQLTRGEQEAMLDRVGSAIEDTLRNSVNSPSAQSRAARTGLKPMAGGFPQADAVTNGYPPHNRTATLSQPKATPNAGPLADALPPSTSNVAVYGNIKAGISNVGGSLNIDGPVSVVLGKNGDAASGASDHTQCSPHSISALMGKSQLADAADRSSLQRAVQQIAARLQAIQAAPAIPLEPLIGALHALWDELTSARSDTELVIYLCAAVRHTAAPFAAHYDEIRSLADEIADRACALASGDSPARNDR